MDSLIRFTFSGLSLSQRLALSWLIDQGGTDLAVDVCAFGGPARRSNRFQFGALGKVTGATIDSLVRRDYLDRSEDRRTVQISRYAVGEACKFLDNPHPEPIMLARAEHLARLAQAARTARDIADTWANRNTTESD